MLMEFNRQMFCTSKMSMISASIRDCSTKLYILTLHTFYGVTTRLQSTLPSKHSCFIMFSLCCIVFAVCAVAVCASCTAANVCLAAFDLRRAVPRPQRQPADGQSASCEGWGEANADLLLAIINHELRIPSVYNYRCRSQFQHVFPLPPFSFLSPPRRQGQTE